jgi:phage-related holin
MHNFDVNFYKLFVAFAVAAFLGVFNNFIEFAANYLFDDLRFLTSLAILVVIDTILGVWKSILKGEITSSAFGKFFTKMIIYGFFLVSVNQITEMSINGEKVTYFDWFRELCFVSLMVRELLSIVENMAVVRPGLIPEFVKKRLKKFNETGGWKEEV